MPTKKAKEGETSPWKSPLRKSGSKKKLKAYLDDEETNRANSEDGSIAESSHQRLDQQDGNSDMFSPKKTKSKTKEKKKSKSSASASSAGSLGSLSKDGSVRSKKKKTSKTSRLSNDSESNMNSTAPSSRNKEEDDDVSMVSARSTRSTRSTKSTKSTKSSSAKKKKKKVKDGSGDDASLVTDDDASVRSKKSRPSTKRESSSNTESQSFEGTMALNDGYAEGPSATYSGHHRRSRVEDDEDLKAENEALQAETVTLRKQLNEALQMLDEARTSETQYQDTAQLQKELQRYKKDMSELQGEVDEYEEAVAEKDGLIKKLTEAVDHQLDKVEYLELKLQRAEEEFCNMEDEMKDMEEEIETYRNSSGDRQSSLNEEKTDSDDCLPKNSGHSTGSSDSLRDIADDMQRRLIQDRTKRLDQRENELDIREAEVNDREQEILDRDQNIADREKELTRRDEEDLGAKMDQIRIKELRVQEKERELMETEDRLETMKAAHEERVAELEMEKIQAREERSNEQTAKDLEQSLGVLESDVIDEPDKAESPFSEEVNRLMEQIEELNREKEELKTSLMEKDHETHDSKEMVSDLKERLKEYQIETADLRQANAQFIEMQKEQDQSRQAQHDLVIQSIHEGNKKQIQELYEENRKLQAEVTVLTERNEVLKASIPDEGVDPKDFAMTGLQEEIAGLREKIVVKEREAKGLRNEIEKRKSEQEESATEMKELETELASLSSQMKENKDSAAKKMAQKDETISFMQNEMVRIMKEKTDVDKTLAEKESLLKEPESLREHSSKTVRKKDEEVEMAKIQAFNEQLESLDAENRQLQEKLDHARIQHEMEIKSKDAKILEVQDEVADLNWEMKARKEADYVTLLKDRKERKKELETTKKQLKESEERVADLEREINGLQQNQEYLEKDVEELNKSLMVRDSGDYVSGLKRQIRSLKEHNMALERNIEIESANSAQVLERNQETIKKLEQEIKDMKNPAQAAVRGIFAFGNRDNKSKDGSGTNSTNPDEAKHGTVNDGSEKASGGTSEVEEKTATNAVAASLKVASPSQPPTPSRKASLWNALISPFGAKRNIISAPLESKDQRKQPESAPIKEEEKEAQESGPDDDLEGDLQAIEGQVGGSTEHVRDTDDAVSQRPQETLESPNDVAAGTDVVSDDEVELVPIQDPDSDLAGQEKAREDSDVESLGTAEEIDTDDDVDLVEEDEEGITKAVDLEGNGKDDTAPPSKESIVFV